MYSLLLVVALFPLSSGTGAGITVTQPIAEYSSIEKCIEAADDARFTSVQSLFGTSSRGAGYGSVYMTGICVKRDKK